MNQTLASAAAISKVPTVSMLEAMIGTPSCTRFECRNVNLRRISTSARDLIELRFGRSSTSLKSSFTSWITFGILMKEWVGSLLQELLGQLVR